MIVKFKGREVEIDGIMGTIDEPIVDNAYYIDGEEENLTDEEMDELQYIYAGELSQALSEKFADDYHDFLMDR